MLTDGGRRPRKARPKAITIALLSAEYLPTIKVKSRSLAYYFSAKRALDVLAGMPEVRTTADLVLTEAFLERFLEAYGSSIRRETILGILRQLGHIRDWAADMGYLPRAESARPVLIPPTWDDRHERFAQSSRDLGQHWSRRADPDPAWGDVVRLVDVLKVHSRRWLDARLFVLVSLVTLARLFARSEASMLRRTDIDWAGPDRRIRVAPTGKKPIKVRRARASRPLNGHLAEILDRWSRRSGPEYLIPNQERDGPWEISCSDNGGTANAWLADACRDAEIPILTLRGLKRFGEANLDRLRGPESPFRLEPGDGVLMAEPIPVAQLRAEVIDQYEPEQASCLWAIDAVFQSIAALPEIATSFDLATPDGIGRLAAAAGILDPYAPPHGFIIGWVHTISNISLSVGYSESSPFAGRHGFRVQMRRGRRPIGRPRGLSAIPKPGTSPAIVLAGSGIDDPTNWTTPPVVNGVAKSPLSEKQARTLWALVQSGPDGLTGNTLRVKSNVPGWWGILKALQRSDADYGGAILFPGAGSKNYRIRFDLL